MALVPSVLQAYPDVWYDPLLLGVFGTGSYVVVGLATAYFVLKWLKNSEKFYAALHRQEEASKAMPGGRWEEKEEM